MRSGLLGVVMRRYDFPTAPVVVGMILGPLAEAQMRNALSIGEGSWLVFVQRPMSLVLLLVVVGVLLLPRGVADVAGAARGRGVTVQRGTTRHGQPDVVVGRSGAARAAWDGRLKFRACRRWLSDDIGCAAESDAHVT